MLFAERGLLSVHTALILIEAGGLALKYAID